MTSANPILLTVGLILGFIFVGAMIFRVLPTADQIVKREYGPAEACLCTRFCCLCVALPLYVFTIWMAVVILVDPYKGISIIQEVCPKDYDCVNSFAWGREQFDKTACVSADCSEEDLYARSGSHPLVFNMGLGQNMDPNIETIEYTCLDSDATTGVCMLAKETESEEVCECNDTIAVSDGHDLCSKYVGCDGDVSGAVWETECTSVGGDGACESWTVSTDSAKQFSFYNCSCTDESCDQYSCEVFTMLYFYPNVFFAGLVTVLFVLPFMVITYVLLKTQLRKLCPLTDVPIYVYSQAGGMQDEQTAENLASGGFTQDQVVKTKYRSCSRKDVLAWILAPAILVFTCYFVIITAGRIGVAFICLSAVVILLKELYSLTCFLKKAGQRMNDRMEANTPDPERAQF